MASESGLRLIDYCAIMGSAWSNGSFAWTDKAGLKTDGT